MRNPSRSDSIVSESTYKYIGSDGDSSKPKLATTENAIPITRKLPIVADVIIFLTQLLLAACFIYFAYFYKPIDTLTCYAAYGDDQPVPQGSNTYAINVSKNFRMAIRFGFWITILNFTRAVINQLGIRYKSASLYYISIVMYGFNALLFLVWFIFTQRWRWNFAGIICSEILVVEGYFLKFMLVAVYSIIGLGIVTTLLLALFCS